MHWCIYANINSQNTVWLCQWFTRNALISHHIFWLGSHCLLLRNVTRDMVCSADTCNLKWLLKNDRPNWKLHQMLSMNIHLGIWVFFTKFKSMMSAVTFRTWHVEHTSTYQVPHVLWSPVKLNPSFNSRQIRWLPYSPVCTLVMNLQFEWSIMPWYCPWYPTMSRSTAVKKTKLIYTSPNLSHLRPAIHFMLEKTTAWSHAMASMSRRKQHLLTLCDFILTRTASQSNVRYQKNTSTISMMTGTGKNKFDHSCSSNYFWPNLSFYKACNRSGELKEM